MQKRRVGQADPHPHPRPRPHPHPRPDPSARSTASSKAATAGRWTEVTRRTQSRVRKSGGPLRKAPESMTDPSGGLASPRPFSRPPAVQVTTARVTTATRSGGRCSQTLSLHPIHPPLRRHHRRPRPRPPGRQWILSIPICGSQFCLAQVTLTPWAPTATTILGLACGAVEQLAEVTLTLSVPTISVSVFLGRTRTTGCRAEQTAAV